MVAQHGGIRPTGRPAGMVAGVLCEALRGEGLRLRGAACVGDGFEAFVEGGGRVRGGDAARAVTRLVRGSVGVMGGWSS